MITTLRSTASAIALLLPDLIRWGRPGERLAIYALSLSTQCLSLALALREDYAPHLPIPPISLGCVALVATLILSWRILTRANAEPRVLDSAA